MTSATKALDLTELRKLDRHSPVQAALPWLIVVIVGFMITPLTLFISGGDPRGLLAVLPSIFLSGGVLGAGIAGWRAHLKQLVIIKQFALDNNLELKSDPELMALLPQSIANKGHSHKYMHGYEFTIAGKPVTVFNYQYSEGHGKNQRTFRFGAAVLSTKKSYPHLFLDGSVNGASWSYSGNQKISLEGNFDKYFKLYAPKESKSVALAILTPDVMQTLINSAASYDVEIFDKSISFVSNKSFYGFQQLQDLEKCIKAVSGEFDHKEVSWRPVYSATGQPMKLTRRNFGKLALAGFIIYILFQIVSALIDARIDTMIKARLLN